MIAVVPKSGWPRVRAIGRAGISAAVISTRGLLMWARYRSRKSASIISTAILANSEGWKLMPAMPIHRAAPLALYWMPGT